MSPAPFAADLFSSLTNLVLQVGKLGAAVLIVGIGIKAFTHVWSENHGAALAIALVALLPAAFLFDPSGMSSLYQATVGKVLH
jgi:hypothetical protein